MNHAVEQINSKLKFSWGIGALGVAILMNSGTFLVLAYLIKVVGISPALAGTIMLVTKGFDAISDPVVGRISDRFEHKNGRRRPFMFVGTFIATLAFLLLFTIPSFDSEFVTAAYALGVLFLYTIGYTLFNVPYMAMSAEMTDNYEERTKLHGMRVIFVSIGSTIVAAGGPFLLQQFGADWNAYAIIGVLFSIFIFAAMMACYFGTEDARTYQATVTSYSVKEQIGLLFQNKPFLAIISTKFLQLIGIMSSASVTLIFFQDYMRINLKFLSVFGITNTIVTILTVPLLIKLAEHIGKRNTYIFSALVSVAINISWAMVPSNADMGEEMFGLILRAAGLGLVIGGNVMMAMSMLMDSIEYDRIKTGMRREGIYAACYSFVEKFAAMFGPFLIGLILQFTGYDNKVKASVSQSDEAMEGIVFGMSYLPAFFIGLSIITLLFYKLDKNSLAELRAERGVDNTE